VLPLYNISHKTMSEIFDPQEVASLVQCKYHGLPVETKLFKLKLQIRALE